MEHGLPVWQPLHSVDNLPISEYMVPDWALKKLGIIQESPIATLLDTPLPPVVTTVLPSDSPLFLATVSSLLWGAPPSNSTHQ